jgi:hypothetical protein
MSSAYTSQETSFFLEKDEVAKLVDEIIHESTIEKIQEKIVTMKQIVRSSYHNHLTVPYHHMIP